MIFLREALVGFTRERTRKDGTLRSWAGEADLRQYAEDTWLPNHEMEATTRQGYT
jgi:hypothetical protein